MFLAEASLEAPEALEHQDGPFALFPQAILSDLQGPGHLGPPITEKSLWEECGRESVNGTYQEGPAQDTGANKFFFPPSGNSSGQNSAHQDLLGLDTWCSSSPFSSALILKVDSPGKSHICPFNIQSLELDTNSVQHETFQVSP